MLAYSRAAAKQNAEKRQSAGTCRKVNVLLGELTSFAMHDSALKAILRSPFLPFPLLNEKLLMMYFTKLCRETVIVILKELQRLVMACALLD